MCQTEYFDSGGNITTTWSSSFSPGAITGPFDFRIFFYEIQTDGQYRLRTQYRFAGGSWRNFQTSTPMWFITSFATPYGEFYGGSFELGVSGWDGGALTYQNIGIDGDTNSPPLDGDFIQGYSIYVGQNITELVPPQGNYGTVISVSGTVFHDQRCRSVGADESYRLCSFVTFSNGLNTMIATQYPFWSGSGTELEVVFEDLFIDLNSNYIQDWDEPLLSPGEISGGDYAVNLDTIWFLDINANSIYDAADQGYDTFSSNELTFGFTLPVPVYSCVGFEPPCDGSTEVALTVKKNKCVPLKTELIAEDDFPITDADIESPPVLDCEFAPATAPTDVVSVDGLPSGQATSGNQFEFIGGRWCFNLKVKDYYTAPGTYTLEMISGDPSEYVIDPTCSVTILVEK